LLGKNKLIESDNNCKGRLFEDFYKNEESTSVK